jgi:hypothetical protein
MVPCGTMKTKFARTVAVLDIANTIAPNKKISLLISSVVFVAALDTWLVTARLTEIPTRLRFLKDLRHLR